MWTLRYPQKAQSWLPFSAHVVGAKTGWQLCARHMMTPCSASPALPTGGNLIFYNSIGVTRWPSNARYCPGKGTLHATSDGTFWLAPEDRLLQGTTLYEDDQEESVEREGPWFMLVCIGKRGPLRNWSPDPRAVHIFLPMILHPEDNSSGITTYHPMD